MRGSKALKLLIYCLWSIFVIHMHARWLELQWFFQMGENTACKENLTEAFPSCPVTRCPAQAMECTAGAVQEEVAAPLHHCAMQVTWKRLQSQEPLEGWSGLSQWHTPGQALPSDMHSCLLLRQPGALPVGRILPLNSACLQASGTTVPECRISLLAAPTIDWC